VIIQTHATQAIAFGWKPALTLVQSPLAMRQIRSIPTTTQLTDTHSDVNLNICTVKVCHLYSASSKLLHFWSTQHGSHSFLYCKYTMPPLPHSSLGGAMTEWTVIAPADEVYYSFIEPVRMKGWVGLVGLPTADGLPI